jgi:hypothetical protein
LYRLTNKLGSRDLDRRHERAVRYQLDRLLTDHYEGGEELTDVTVDIVQDGHITTPELGSDRAAANRRTRPCTTIWLVGRGRAPAR